MISDADRPDQWNYSHLPDIPTGISEAQPYLQSTTTHVSVDLTAGIQTEEPPKCRPTDPPQSKAGAQDLPSSREERGRRRVGIRRAAEDDKERGIYWSSPQLKCLMVFQKKDHSVYVEGGGGVVQQSPGISGSLP